MGQLRVTQPFAMPVPMGGYAMPPEFTISYLAGDEPGAEPDLDIEFEVRDGAPRCRSVKITAHPDGAEITRTDLRSLRLEDLLEYAVSAVGNRVRQVGPRGETFQCIGKFGPEVWRLEHVEDDAGQRHLMKATRTARSEARRRKMTDDVLRDVAEVYRKHVADTPTAAVADYLDRSLRTASLYVQRARAKGFLGAAITGRAGEQQ